MHSHMGEFARDSRGNLKNISHLYSDEAKIRTQSTLRLTGMRTIISFLLFFFSALTAHASPPDATQVFVLSATQSGPDSLTLTWTVRDGYFLYADKMHIKTGKGANFQPGTLQFPAPESKTDARGNVLAIYRNTLKLPIPVLAKAPGEALLRVGFQGCSDTGYCYPPQSREVRLTFNAARELTGVTLEPEAVESAPPSAAPVSAAADSYTALLTDSNWMMIILSFLGFGLLLSFTPCVLPMVPVLSGIIVGHGKDLTHRKAFFLSLCYVLSMSLTYAFVGALVAVLGKNLQIAMQSPVILLVFSLIFVALAASMFGWYELRLPVSWQARLASVTRRQESGHYLGAAVMGCLSTLILSPCVTAPLIGVLGYIANTGNVLLGTVALFCLGLGMGIPLLLIGASAGKWLPKAGAWMQTVKSFFGLLLLAVAVHLLTRILPPTVGMLLWATLLVFSGIGFGALLPAHTHLSQIRQGCGILLLGYGLLILVGASLGNTNPLQPLAGSNSGIGYAAAAPARETVTSPAALDSALARAGSRPVVLDFYADWCSSCKAMELTTLKDPAVEAALTRTLFLRVDVTANTADSRALMKRFGVVAPPAFIFLAANGQEQPQLRLVGETGVETFLQSLNGV